jgi:hypothetical protein
MLCRFKQVTSHVTGIFRLFEYLFFLRDWNLFFIPELSFIPGIRHFSNFFAMVTLNFTPLYVVLAEVKRQQNKEKNR